MCCTLAIATDRYAPSCLKLDTICLKVAFMDALSDIFQKLSFTAHVFFSGNLCGMQHLGGPETNRGYLHLLKAGILNIELDDGHRINLEQPTVIFIPGVLKHRLIADESIGAELVCADIDFHTGGGALLVNALPTFLCLDVAGNDAVGKAASWLFEEAYAQLQGRQLMANKLAELFLLQIMRYVLDEGLVVQGMLAAMAHPQLARIMTALHRQPEYSWTVDNMAEQALMSRAKFAAMFKRTVGQAPADYLTDLRIAIAKGLLQENKSVSYVANEVGYEQGSALARVFRKKLGLSPKQWLENFRK